MTVEISSLQELIFAKRMNILDIKCISIHDGIRAKIFLMNI